MADFPFIRRCQESDRVAIEKIFRDAISATQDWTALPLLDVARLPPIDRQFLVERQLVGRELADAAGARSVLIDEGETFSLMINEEDHLRMQVMHSGFDLEAAWEQINIINDQIDSRVNYAFHERLGYLTACPTNVGTGLRVSVMLHLPALVITQQMKGLPQPAKNGARRPRPLRRRLAGDGRFLPDQQPNHARPL